MRNEATGLAHQYRRLLYAYPRAYRQDRGDEIVDTLLASASPGQRRPTVRQAINLLLSGFRCQLGRPRSGAIVLVAVLAAVATGFLGVAAGTLAGWYTARPLPSATEARAIYQTVLPGHAPNSSELRDFHFKYEWTGDWWPQFNNDLDLGVTASQGSVEASYDMKSVGGDPRDFSQKFRERLRSAGWQVHGFGDYEGGSGELLATKDGLDLSMTYLPPIAGFPGDEISLSIGRDRPIQVIPLAAAGALLGLVAGWLLTGWISRRTVGGSLATQFGVLLLGVGACLSVLPSFGVYVFTVYVTVLKGSYWDSLSDAVGRAWFSLLVPPFHVLALAGMLALLAALVIASRAHRVRGRTDGPVNA